MSLPFVVQTSQPVATVECFEHQALRRGLTGKGLRLLKSNQIQVRVEKGTGKTTRNDMDEDLVQLSPRTRFVRISNMTELVLTQSRALVQPWQSLVETPSLMLAKFILFPQQFAHSGNAVEDLPAFFSRKELSGMNTSSIETDTEFPSLNTPNTRVVVVGLEEAIREHLGGRNNYAEACQDALEKMLQGKSCSDFPVLAAIDHQQIVVANGKCHVVDFYEETSSLGKPLVPLVLTSCSEVKSRIQLQYLEILYSLGAVKLHRKPIDSGRRLYRLADDDEVSVQMGLNRSTSILYSLSVCCCSCGASHHDLWRIGIESTDPGWLTDVRCRLCNSPVVNRSCFVLRSSRGKIDPSTVRKLHYSLPPDFDLNKKKLPKYEHVCHLTNGSRLKLHVRQDFARKNLHGTAITATVFVPVVYSIPEEEGLEVERSHQLMHVYVSGYEHVLPIMCTRVKISLTCKRSCIVNTPAQRENEHLFAHLGQTFEKFSERELRVHFPHSYTTKRLGVEVRHSDGSVQQHSASVLLQQSTRVKGRKAAALRKEVSSSMYSCQHFCGTGIDSDENNFTRYGLTVAAGLVFNFCALKPRYEQSLSALDFGVQEVVAQLSETERTLIGKSYVKVKVAQQLRSELAKERAFSSHVLKELLSRKALEPLEEDDFCSEFINSLLEE